MPVKSIRSAARTSRDAARGLPKPVRVIGGMLLMAGVVLVVLAILLRYAGGWGVPFFSFTSERGSQCRNDLTGYTCDPLSLSDLEFYTDLDLPDDTRVVKASYTATHDYRLAADLTVPAASAEAATAALADAYGKCRKGVAPMNTTGLTKVCVRSNDAAVDLGEPSSQIYQVGSGMAADGSMVVGMAIRSR